MKRYTSILLSACALLSVSAHSAQILTNGNFNSNNEIGWNVGIVPDYSDGGRPYRFDTSGDGWIFTNGRAENGFDGGVRDSNNNPCYLCDLTFYLNQSFSYSDSLDSASLSFNVFAQANQTRDLDGSGPDSPDRTFDVSFLDSNNDLLGNVYSYVNTAASSSDNRLSASVTIDVTSILEGLSGELITLNFEEVIGQYYTGPGLFWLDNVVLDIETSPAVSSNVPEPSIIALMSLGIFGLGLSRRRMK